MKAVQQPADVSADDGGVPVAVRWAGRTLHVTVIDAWRAGGRWWLGEAPRDCFLVNAGSLTAELHREDRPGGPWWLARLQD
ncbi:hypothetical protein [uncultured Deinococcus sp.]|uniref:hypothetical protein n=1 Tax=uncultured Deinococcus sp. TaxID=158789 RepID=UPI0025EAF181|nr:hypothetical protein [uncultured Deinococcus sp.]